MPIKTEYMDVLMKAEYYRKRAVSSLAKYGEILSDKAIQDRLNSIDLYQPIYKSENVLSEDNFDADKFTYDIEEIYSDLVILYEILHSLSVKTYEESQSYVETHIREMELAAKRYKARIDIETNSTSLGDTVFHMDGPFAWFTKDTYAYTDLGPAKVKRGSELALIMSGRNASADNVLVGIVIDDKIEYLTAYNYERATYSVPGQAGRKKYEHNFDKNTILDSTFELSPEELSPRQVNTYVTYAGKNKISIKQNNVVEHVSQTEDLAYHVDGEWEVSFYIKDGTYAHFEFSKDIQNKNFEGIEITDLPSVKKIVMRDREVFAFSVRTDGVIYAEQKLCRVANEKLYYPNGCKSNDFLIEEYVAGEEIEVNLFLRVLSSDESYPEIDSIAIKELLETDVVFNDLL